MIFVLILVFTVQFFWIAKVTNRGDTYHFRFAHLNHECSALDCVIPVLSIDLELPNRFIFSLHFCLCVNVNILK
jgi:hypothetical protein